MTRRWTSRVIGSATLGLAVLLWSASAAVALDTMVPTLNASGTCTRGGALESDAKRVCQTDNASVGYWMEASIDNTTGSDTTAERSINATMDRDYDLTVLNTFYDSSPVFSGPGETDIVYRARSVDFNDPKQNLIGYMWCDDPANGQNACDQAYINFITSGLQTNWSLACHETGHAVGLVHGYDAYPRIDDLDSRLGCMRRPAPATGSETTTTRYLGAQNVEEIRRTYS